MHWSPPPDDHYKANFDTAFFGDSEATGVGIVVRDCSRQIIGALRKNIGLVQSVEMAEAMAAQRAMMFAKELCLFRAIFERDCSRVLDALKGLGCCRTLFGHIIDEAKRLGGILRSYLFQHVRQEGTRLAHCLAKKAVLFANTDIYIYIYMGLYPRK